MKKIFTDSLKDNYDVEYILFDPEEIEVKPGRGLKIWIFKTKLIIGLIEKNFGESIIISDIDIQFFKKTETIVKTCLEKYDLVFQGENRFNKVNIGFMAFNCNRDVLEFWREVLINIEKERIWDQIVVNNLILNKKVNWGFFPKEIWNWSISHEWKSIALHHATSATDIRLKLFQYKIVRIVNYLKGINKFDITYILARRIFKTYKIKIIGEKIKYSG